MRGGYRANSGRRADPDALRRDRPGDAATWTTLPAIGRQGEPPPFPLLDPTEVELSLWSVEWRRPQAVEWDRNGQEVEVALYVRTLADAARPGASVGSRTLVTQWRDVLGLSLPGLLRHRWRIESPP